jgi:hypothetical protein
MIFVERCYHRTIKRYRLWGVTRKTTPHVVPVHILGQSQRALCPRATEQLVAGTSPLDSPPTRRRGQSPPAVPRRSPNETERLPVNPEPWPPAGGCPALEPVVSTSGGGFPPREWATPAPRARRWPARGGRFALAGWQPPLKGGRLAPDREMLAPWGGRLARRGELSPVGRQPAALQGEPSASGGQCSTVQGEPAASGGQPSGFLRQPSASGGERPTVVGQPSGVRGEPAASGGQPAAPGGEPAGLGRWRPGGGAQPSGSGG